MHVPTAMMATTVPTFTNGFMMIALAVFVWLVVVALIAKTMSYLKKDSPKERRYLAVVWAGSAVVAFSCQTYVSIGLIGWAFGDVPGDLLAKASIFGVILGVGIAIGGALFPLLTRERKQGVQTPKSKPVGTEATA